MLNFIITEYARQILATNTGYTHTLFDMILYKFTILYKIFHMLRRLMITPYETCKLAIESPILFARVHLFSKH